MNNQLLGEQTIRAVIGFPKYIFEWLLGLLWAVLSVYDATSIALAAGLIGLATDSLIYGIIAFLLIWIIVRAIGNHADAVVTAGHAARPLPSDMNMTTKVAVPGSHLQAPPEALQAGAQVREGN